VPEAVVAAPELINDVPAILAAKARPIFELARAANHSFHRTAFIRDLTDAAWI
jgi:hypothetical protein